jgi:hypothetical protein
MNLDGSLATAGEGDVKDTLAGTMTVLHNEVGSAGDAARR